MDNTERGLLEAVLASSDDFPRLVYADWLVDAGGTANAARGELIRVQIEWASHNPYRDRRCHCEECGVSQGVANSLIEVFAAEWLLRLSCGFGTPLSPSAFCWVRGFPVDRFVEDARPECPETVERRRLEVEREERRRARDRAARQLRAVVGADRSKRRLANRVLRDMASLPLETVSQVIDALDPKLSVTTGGDGE